MKRRGVLAVLGGVLATAMMPNWRARQPLRMDWWHHYVRYDVVDDAPYEFVLDLPFKLEHEELMNVFLAVSKHHPPGPVTRLGYRTGHMVHSGPRVSVNREAVLRSLLQPRKLYSRKV